jgi:hypothetical protein
MKFTQVCSLGSLCHTSFFFKINGFKRESSPFDWVFSHYTSIIHCIEDDFQLFLDKSYYIHVEQNKCKHSYYNDIVFYHHNPLINEKHYDYYIRCVRRFQNLLLSDEDKLFMLMNVNLNNIPEETKTDIIEFERRFSNYTKNYRLVVIFHIPNKPQNQFIITQHGNIDFIELHTLSSSNGTSFDTQDDNDYFYHMMKKHYNIEQNAESNAKPKVEQNLQNAESIYSHFKMRNMNTPNNKKRYKPPNIFALQFH